MLAFCGVQCDALRSGLIVGSLICLVGTAFFVFADYLLLLFPSFLCKHLNVLLLFQRTDWCARRNALTLPALLNHAGQPLNDLAARFFAPPSAAAGNPLVARAAATIASLQGSPCYAAAVALVVAGFVCSAVARKTEVCFFLLFYFLFSFFLSLFVTVPFYCCHTYRFDLNVFFVVFTAFQGALGG